MKYLLVILTSLLSVTVFAQEDVHVRSYTRTNGTYVPNHYRTPKNNTINDNYTTKGNVNPYTGKSGYIPREGSSKNTRTQSYSARNSYKTKVPKYNYSNSNYNSFSPNNSYNTKPKRTKTTNSYYIY